ncbi:MAG: hypothetical protein ACI4MI_03040 [Christensenellales bacterium]
MNNVMVVDVVDERSRLALQILQEKYETLTLGQYLDLPERKPCNMILSVPSVLDEKAVAKVAPNSRIFYFFMGAETRDILTEKGCECINVLKVQRFVDVNSYLTAEGSLEYIIQNTDKCIRDMTFGVIGWGNLAKAMVKLLGKFESRAIVLTRSKEEKKQTVISGREYMPFDECDYTQFDCIINTVPYRLFEKNPPVDHDVFVLELASKIYPFDYDDFKDKGIRYMIASSVPSKTAPRSAAQLLCDVALSLST